MLSKFKVHLVGVSFVPGYPDNLLSLHREQRDVAIQVELAREPMNPFDENAVLVCRNGEPLGHIPAGLAARLSPMLADGALFSCVLDEVLVSSEAPDRPGAVISCERADNHE